ncbi:MAG: cation:proton antiporter [Acidimicrobiia bacterium]
MARQEARSERGASAIEAGANRFVAAFVGGMAFGSIMPGDDPLTLGFTDDAGELLSLLVWLLFGATMTVPAFVHLVWQDVVFAVLALTVVRMVPVAIALAGTGVDRATVAFVGWFGPRGLASVVFVLIAVDSLDPADGKHAAELHRQRPEHRETADLRTRSLGKRPA